MNKKVVNKFNFAMNRALQHWPILASELLEDLKQEIHTMILANPDVNEIADFGNLVNRTFHAFARDNGIKRPKFASGYQVMETLFVEIEEDSYMGLEQSRIEKIIGEDHNSDLDEWSYNAYLSVRTLLQGSEDFKLFLAWLHGWSQEEIKAAFGITDVASTLSELGESLRTTFGIESDEPFPMPQKRFRSSEHALAVLRAMLDSEE